jgi:hypothetical protein
MSSTKPLTHQQGQPNHQFNNSRKPNDGSAQSDTYQNDPQNQQGQKEEKQKSAGESPQALISLVLFFTATPSRLPWHSSATKRRSHSLKLLFSELKRTIPSGLILMVRDLLADE